MQGALVVMFYNACVCTYMFMYMIMYDIVLIMMYYFLLTGVQFEATEVATEESEDSEVGGCMGQVRRSLLELVVCTIMYNAIPSQ